jgi:glycosyltransferase involved in cell wall biosynthesis
MRALIVTNMYPSPDRPALGSFVRDQVDALRRTGQAEIAVFAFAPGGALAYVRGAAALRWSLNRGSPRFDIVHAHFGLTEWPALAVPARARLVTLHGTDVSHPRSRALTLAGGRLMDLVAAVSEPLAREVPRWATRRPVAVLPCGVDLHRFQPIDRARARRELGLDPETPCLLFPADPARAEKRFDRARELAGEIPLLTLGNVDPAAVPLWVNAANAVLVPSEREGFGLATLEALACDVPVLATPVGIAPEALDGVPGALCAEFDPDTWSAALAPHLAAADPRISGRAHAERFSSDAMALRVLDTWRELLGEPAGAAPQPPPTRHPPEPPPPRLAALQPPAAPPQAPPAPEPPPSAPEPPQTVTEPAAEPAERSDQPRGWLIPASIIVGVAAVFLVVFLIVLSNLTGDANRQAAADTPAPALRSP